MIIQIEKMEKIQYQNDKNPGKCAINQKRTDLSWANVKLNDDLFDLTTNTSLISTPICNIENITEKIAHGGKVSCNETGATVLNESKLVLAIVNEPVFYYDAAAYCQKRYNGHVFGEIDGTQEQLAKIYERFAG